MDTQAEEAIRLIRDFSVHRRFLVTFFGGEDVEVNEDSHTFATSLLTLPVTKLSKFSDDVWDYNADALNPAKNVQGAKLRIDFSKYEKIPKLIQTELKCLFYYVYLCPLTYRGRTQKRNGKASFKANTLITVFSSGLRFFHHVFSQIEENGVEFVQSNYESISDLLESDFAEAATDYPLTVDNSLHKFFSYLKNPASHEVLGYQVQVDFDELDWPVQVKKSRVARSIFSNEDYSELVYRCSANVINFLWLMGSTITDQSTLKHIELRKTFGNIQLSPEIFNDYAILRLRSKGYGQPQIEELFTIPEYLYGRENRLYGAKMIRKVVSEHHNIENFDDVRLAINEIYYSCAFLVGINTGMRPSALSEIRLNDRCIVEEDDVFLIVSEEKKGRDLSLSLFDDKWVVTPIVRDAVQAATMISGLKANQYLFSNMDTLAPGKVESGMASNGIKHMFENFLSMTLGKKRMNAISFNPYMLRHTLAYQLHRADLGLPFISFHLKHFIDQVEKYTVSSASSATTLAYGEIAQKLTSGQSESKSIRHIAELERVKAVMDPDGTYLGPKGKEHKKRLQRLFQGYMASGFSKDEVFEKMSEQGIAVINVGTGFCYGGVEDFDESLPCIGSLRCNPIRCSNAVVSKANIPKWREVYLSNRALLKKSENPDMEPQILAAMREAEAVLKDLGEDMIA